MTQQNAKGIGTLLRWPVLIPLPAKKKKKVQKEKGKSVISYKEHYTNQCVM